MSNHIICLEAIVRKNDFTRARKYLGDMVGNVKWDLAKKFYKSQSGLMFYEQGYIKKNLPEELYALG